jgi:hypothetical protein
MANQFSIRRRRHRALLRLHLQFMGYCHTTQQKHNVNTHFNSPETNTSYVEKGQTLPPEPSGTPTEDSPTILAAAKT